MTRTPAAAAPEWALSADDEELSLFDIANAVLRHRRRILLAVVAAVGLTSASVVLGDDTYTTNISFVPASTGSISMLSGLAAQFGVSIPGASGDGQQPPQFYADLIESQAFLQRVVAQPFHVEMDGRQVVRTFAQLYEIDEETPNETTAEAIRTLNEQVLSVGSSRETGVVRVAVNTEWPTLSRDIAERILVQIDAFNLTMRQQQAAAESRFMSARVDSARMDLRNAENRLQDFLQRNREFRTDPRLLFEHDRLEREVQMRQEVYTTISQAHEQARLEAVRNTPSISAVEPAQIPLRADRKYLVLKALMAAMTAGGIALVLAIWADLRTRDQRGGGRSARAEFDHLLSETLNDLRRAFLLRRSVPVTSPSAP